MFFTTLNFISLSWPSVHHKQLMTDKNLLTMLGFLDSSRGLLQFVLHPEFDPVMSMIILSSDVRLGTSFKCGKNTEQGLTVAFIFFTNSS